MAPFSGKNYEVTVAPGEWKIVIMKRLARVSAFSISYSS